MGLFNSIRLGSSAAGDYEIERSLRFNRSDDPQLQRTASSTSNTFTFSTWLKRASLSTYQYFFSVGGQGLLFSNDDGIRVNSDSGANTSTAKFRDLSAWYHVVLSMSSGSATVYVNNVAYLSSVSGFSLSTSTNYLKVGWLAGDPGQFNFDGYLAETQLIDGTALTPSSFAETDAVTGEYKPKRYGGGYGTSGFLLNYSDNSGTTATTLGKDTSGNGNNFTPNNFSVSAGAGNDSLEDTPTNNFCTLNPLDSNSGINFTNGNLVVNTSAGFDLAKSTFYLTSGKWYWEVTCDDTGNGFIGVSDQDDVLNNRGGGNATSCTIAASDGDKRISGSTSSYGSAVADGDVMMFAVDKDANKFWAGKNGTWFNSGDPAAGSNEATSALTNPVSPSVSLYDNEDYTFNFGQRAFSYTPPTGYKKICTANLPDPSIKLPDKHFETLIYTGTDTSANRTISGLEFSPDLVWQKRRNGTNWHTLMDTVRGTGKTLFSNDASAEASNNQYGYVSAFTSDGYTWSAGSTNNSDGNETNGTFVSWNWNAGGSTVTNNDGSISSQVRANSNAGISIVSYTGTGSTATVGHGLGVAPKFIITKQRSTSGHHWRTYHASIGATKSLYLDLTNAQSGTDAGFMNNTEPTSTVFSIGTDTNINENGETHIAYCFSEVAGYSKAGSYTGNGSSDGTFVFTGFRPAWILAKRSSSSENWALWDNKRDGGFNPNGYLLRPDSSTDEGGNVSGHYIDILSNGFKFRNSDTKSNGSGNTYIYLAFAESPFKYSRAR